jgi:hypothetical protein
LVLLVLSQYFGFNLLKIKEKISKSQTKNKNYTMTHYRMSDSMPSAIILAKNPQTGSLDELKIYQINNIFLNNGDEFQIRLFNPLREKIGVQICFNGKSSSHYLVLNPGEDTIIDRFIDDQKKMVFETYKYDNNNTAAKNAVANNGLVEIKFYKEYFYIPTEWYTYTTNIPYGTPYNGSITTSGTFNLTNSNANTCLNNAYSNNIINDSSVYQNLEFTNEKTKSIKETGRVEKGEQSEQLFENVQTQFEITPFHNISYYLRPFSEKNTYVKTDVRKYCTKCGYRLRNSSWSYCPKCGNKL